MTRFFDLFFSTLAIVILSPLFLATMVLLKFTGEHEVFYLQGRIGRGEKKFDILKFATMLKNSSKLPGGFITGTDDPRVLPLGRFLRRTKINELPQLLNIWIGQMSIIGPRPVVETHYLLYSNEQRAIISKLRPGLSGMGSLFFRDEEAILAKGNGDPRKTHDTIAAPYKGELEVWYAKHSSLPLYFKLIALTLVTVLKPSIKVGRFFKDLPEPPISLKEFWF